MMTVMRISQTLIGMIMMMMMMNMRIMMITFNQQENLWFLNLLHSKPLPWVFTQPLNLLCIPPPSDLDLNLKYTQTTWTLDLLLNLQTLPSIGLMTTVRSKIHSCVLDSVFLIDKEIISSLASFWWETKFKNWSIFK